MTSTLDARGNTLRESAGPMALRFRLVPDPQGLEWVLVQARMLGVPCPRALAPRVTARETASGDAVRFSVRVGAAAQPLFCYEGEIHVARDSRS